MATHLGAGDARRLVGGFRDGPRLAMDASVQALVGSPRNPDAMTTGSENAPVTVAAAPEHKPSRRWEISGVVFVLVFLLGIVAPITLRIWQATAATAAVRTGSAGTFVSSTASQGGFFSPALTNVQTTEGSVVVQGTFSAPRGRALAIEELNKTGLHLCAVGDLDTCLPVVGHWAGQLKSTPQAASVFDFVDHGLSSDNLGRWLMAGLILAFITFAWILAGEIGRTAS